MSSIIFARGTFSQKIVGSWKRRKTYFRAILLSKKFLTHFLCFAKKLTQFKQLFWQLWYWTSNIFARSKFFQKTLGFWKFEYFYHLAAKRLNHFFQILYLSTTTLDIKCARAKYFKNIIGLEIIKKYTLRNKKSLCGTLTWFVASISELFWWSWFYKIYVDTESIYQEIREGTRI